MNRYLLNFSYIGTTFKSFTKNLKKGQEIDSTSVQGALEIALQLLKPKNPVKTITSSRTDAGVHALNSTMHVDLQRYNGNPYDSKYIMECLNKYFKETKLPLRVNSTEIVSNEFHAKNSVKSRTYLYRFAIFLDKTDAVSSEQRPIIRPAISIKEFHRCHFCALNEFDIDKAKEAAKLMTGKHDFRSFMGVNSEEKTKRAKFAIRKINSITIQPEANLDDNFQYWSIRFNAKSFVYKQIRRMVGTLIGVAEGKITHQDVYEMLTIPSKHSWPQVIKVVPSYGLYLTNVEYNDESKLIKKSE